MHRVAIVRKEYSLVDAVDKSEGAHSYHHVKYAHHTTSLSLSYIAYLLNYCSLGVKGILLKSHELQVCIKNCSADFQANKHEQDVRKPPKYDLYNGRPIVTCMKYIVKILI